MRACEPRWRTFAFLLLICACDGPKQPQVPAPSPGSPASLVPPLPPGVREPERSAGLPDPPDANGSAVAEPAPAALEFTVPNLPVTLEQLHIKGPVTSPNGVVTSVERQATQIGVDILGRGGNAVDAAVATAFALAVTHPSAGNLAGGGFAVLRMGKQVMALDFREQSPAALTDASFYRMLEAQAKTGAAVGVPGTVAGLLLLHQRYGRLKLDDVVAPAERLAADGYIQGPRQSSTVSWAKDDLLLSPNARRAFFEQGKVRPPGSTIRRPDLALALKRVREMGHAGFYEGPTAQDIVQSLGPDGLITLEDLRSYSAKWREPLAANYRGTSVLTMPPPSAGGAALLTILSILSSVELRPGDDVRTFHYFAEASRRAQVERRLYVAAPERFNEQQLSTLKARWTNPKTWLDSHPIDPLRASRSESVYSSPGLAETEQEHTTHMATADGEGNVVSLTFTLSASFGTRLFTRETGMALNNAVASFSPTGANTPKPNVRTVSSMAPTLLVASDETVALGSPGGDTIPSTVALTLLHLVDLKDDFQRAVRAPRLHQGLFPDRIETEKAHPLFPTVTSDLRAMGHALQAKRYAQGDANLVAWIAGTSHAIADTREGGLALGAHFKAPSPAPLTLAAPSPVASALAPLTPAASPLPPVAPPPSTPPPSTPLPPALPKAP